MLVLLAIRRVGLRERTLRDINLEVIVRDFYGSVYDNLRAVLKCPVILLWDDCEWPEL